MRSPSTRAPKFAGGIATRLDSVVFGIMVNRDAERFYDEGGDTWPKRYAGVLARRARLRQRAGFFRILARGR